MNVLAALGAAPLPSRRRFARWIAQEPALAGLQPGDLRGVLLDESGPVDYDRRDALLAALIRISRTDNQAMVLLMRCLLPGLKRKVAEHGFGLDRDEAASVAVAALSRRIAGYPLLRRPQKIAMNLLLDAGHDLVDARDKELEWRRKAYLTERDTDRATPAAGESPELVWDAARRAGVLKGREIAILRATQVHDIPISEVAPLLGMSVDACRKARQRAVHKLRAWWDADQRSA